MPKLARSPDHNTFHKTRYLQRQAEKGLTPENDADTRAMLEFYDSFDKQEDKLEQDPALQKNNLEYDLRTSEWICAKVKANESYAQNLYAALCNNSFIRNDIFPNLQNHEWSCSWRYAGGIVAHLCGDGDYLDWYCSGIRDVGEDEKDNERWDTLNYVNESVVTDEIREDLFKLGWLVSDSNDQGE